MCRANYNFFVRCQIPRTSYNRPAGITITTGTHWSYLTSIFLFPAQTLIGVGAGRFLGLQRILATISTRLPEMLLCVLCSDVVETVTSETETETWLKFQDDTETWKFETKTRDLTFLWWQLKLTPWIILQQNIWHIAKYQDNKNHPKFVQTANIANIHFHFPLRTLQPQTCGLNIKFHEEMHGHWKCWQCLEGLHIFTRKMSVNKLNIRGVSRCHASMNLFWLRKTLIVLFVTKQYQPFCARTGGDALMKLPCSGLLPSIEVDLCYLRRWRRSESLLFILK